MKVRKQTAVWRTRTGQRIRICDMADSHLRNAIAFIQRRYSTRCAVEACAAYSYADNAPDGAAMCAEGAADELLHNADTLDGIEEEFPLYPKLQADHIRRFGEPAPEAQGDAATLAVACLIISKATDSRKS